MSDTSDPFGFGKFVPGFDFLHNLAKNPASMPGMPSWVAPTLDVEEIDKRIEELRAVQFWLDQNATALKATLQALEVQKMTLATLRGMNVSMEDMAEAFRIKTPPARPFADMSKPMGPFGVPPAADVPRPEPTPEAPPADAQAPADEPVPPTRKAKAGGARAAAPAAAPGVVDPLQWWGALTEQFQQIAGDAMKDVARKAGASGPFAHAFAPAGAAGAGDGASPASGKPAARTQTKTKAAPRSRSASGASTRATGPKAAASRRKR